VVSVVSVGGCGVSDSAVSMISSLAESLSPLLLFAPAPALSPRCIISERPSSRLCNSEDDCSAQGYRRRRSLTGNSGQQSANE
jgi:hypothetical protein